MITLSASTSADYIILFIQTFLTLELFKGGRILIGCQCFYHSSGGSKKMASNVLAIIIIVVV